MKIEKARENANSDPDYYAMLLLHYMQDNITVEKAQVYCLTMIWGSCKGNKSTSGASAKGNKKIIECFMARHVTTYIVSAMTIFKSIRRIQKLCAGSLWCLCVDSKSTNQLVDEGAVEQVIDVLNLFGHDPSVCKHAVGALQSISVERGAREMLVDWNATDAVVKAMNYHLPHGKIQYYGCKYLSNTWIVGKGGIANIPETQIFAVVQALLQHQDNDDVVRAGCLALQNCTCDIKNITTLRGFETINKLIVLLKQEAPKWGDVEQSRDLS